MSDTATQADDGNEDPNLKLLRDKAKKYDEAEATSLHLKRENAMLKSGIDLESPLGKFFVESYAGDPSDAEALKTKATELGVPFTNKIVEVAEVVEIVDPTGTAERSALSDGAPADTGEDKDPRQLAKEQYDKRMAEGAPQEEAAGEHVRMLAEAAMRGDKRVIVEG